MAKLRMRRRRAPKSDYGNLITAPPAFVFTGELSGTEIRGEVRPVRRKRRKRKTK
jgi:hypothetical protein